MMDAEMIEMLRGSLRHVLTETTDRPLADRLADLGWDEVVADDEATALLTLFEVKGDTRSPADALGPLLAGAIADALGDPSLAGASVAFPTSLNPLEPSSTVEGSDLHVRATVLVAPTDATALLVPVEGADGIRLALVGSTKGFDIEAVAETDETQPWVTVTGTIAVAEVTWFDGLAGADAWTGAVAKGRWALSAELIGMAKRTIADAVTYTGERQQYGKAIGTFQALQHRLASAYGSVIGAGHLVEEAAAIGDRWTALVAKAAAGRAAEDACTQAQQCYGAIGFTWEHDFHRYLRRTYVLDRLLGDWRALEMEIGTELVGTRVVPKIGSF
jgi:Acyl-CoA dehydrogenase, C-terminal domain